MNDETTLPPAIQDALAVARSHAAVNAVCIKSIVGVKTVIEVDIDTQLGSRDLANGQATNGVRAVETVIIEFQANYPHSYPQVRLRADFNRNLPHINPHDEGELVPPCLVYGSMSELHHTRGFSGILEQLVDWLKRAGRGTLVDLQRGDGWEPVRRDTIDDQIVFDPAALLAAMSSRDGSITWATRFFAHRDSAGEIETVGFRASNTNVPINGKNIKSIFSQTEISNIYEGNSVSLIFWGASSIIVSSYLPETISNFKQLKEMAAAYGCSVQLEAKFAWLSKVLKQFRSTSTIPIAVIFCVRRPTILLGHNSNIEFLCYRLEISAPILLPEGDNTEVKIVAHRNPVTTSLLRRASGVNEGLATPSYTVIGCGSLGSKITLHLARAGFQPTCLLDNKTMAPHNYARHALLPSTYMGEASFHGIKSYELSRSLECLGRPPKWFNFDLTTEVADSAHWEIVFPRSSDFIINTTGSHGVRDRLARLESLKARVIEAALLNSGKLAILTVEGMGRNPNLADVMAAVYEELRADGTLTSIGDMSAAGSRIGIGQGCESITVAMTDARLSMHAAIISDRLIKWASDHLPDLAQAYIGRIDKDGMSIGWTDISMKPTQVVTAENDISWEIRVLDRAQDKIDSDIARYPGVETGGLIVGRISPIRRTIWITDVLEPPSDSSRSPISFSLGTEGRAELVSEYNNTAAGYLWCLGTWHNHLMDQGGSPTDYDTAKKLKGDIPRAAVLLIRRPNGYSAIVESNSF